MATTENQTEPTDETGDNLPAEVVDTDDALQELYDHAQTLTVEDPEAVQERILRSMLGSQNVADLLRAGEATPAQEVYNVPLTILGIRASESSYDDGGDHYVHVDARLKGNGDAITVSCGARDVVAKLLLADMRGWFPFDAVIVQSPTPTKAGFYPVFLRPIDANEEAF